MCTQQFSGVNNHSHCIIRPIRLADIFLIDRASLNKKLHTKEILDYWNLTDDNLKNQSEETKKFIVGLL